MIKVADKRKQGFIAVSLLVVVGCLCGLTFAAPKRVDILNIEQGRFVVLFDNWYEIDSCLRVFQVRENFFQVRNGCAVEFCDDPLQNEYEVVYAENGELIGALDNALDSPLLIMYDFASGQCWPCDATDTQRVDLFERLKTSNPELQMPDYWH
ncbi:MAG: hypothetical protein CL608_22595 [Anaerolineaceae bacterium]|nr:hypothetical protein [Anaerolineaceae bacterium]